MDHIERIYREWDERSAQRDVGALVALYAETAVFESPLVAHLMETGRGILRGHDELRAFFEKWMRRKPAVRGRFRAGYLTDGRTLFWEYPRETPSAEQMDLAEVMEIEGGLIRRHRVYWGWFAVGTLQSDPDRR